MAHLLPAYAGLLLEREVRELIAVRDDPARPLCVILGGAKVSGKVGVIERFLETADEILIGGAMCFSFFSSQGIAVGDSLRDEKSTALAARILERAEGSSCDLVLPVDLVAGRGLDAETEVRQLDGVEVPDGWMGLDIGPRTASRYAAGWPRREPCSGTARWGRSSSSRSPAGRGPSPKRSPRRRPTRSSAGATRSRRSHEFGLADRVDWLSTGGGASLELMEGGALPGLEALMGQQAAAAGR